MSGSAGSSPSTLLPRGNLNDHFLLCGLGWIFCAYLTLAVMMPILDALDDKNRSEITFKLVPTCTGEEFTPCLLTGPLILVATIICAFFMAIPRLAARYKNPSFTIKFK